MNTAVRSIVHERPPAEQLSPGVWRDAIAGGGLSGPNGEVRRPLIGGQAWTDMFHLGTTDDDFIMTVPEIRMPPNQYWPLHWHGCPIAVVILEGSCLIGDWHMQPGDVLISAAGLEYGPLVVGPEGCRMFEVFAPLHLQGGGYSPEYRDHPTLSGGNFTFEPRTGVNLRNEGRMALPVDGVEGLEKGHLETGARWNLGAPDDPGRGVIGFTVLAPGETIPAHSYADWHGLFILDGSVEYEGRDLGLRQVLIAKPGTAVGAIKAGPGGARIFEAARTAKGMERQSCTKPSPPRTGHRS